MDLLYVLLIGAVSGWLAGQLFKGSGSGLLWNIILGVLGSFVGGWVLGKLDINLNLGSHLVNLIATSVIGAVVLLLLGRLLGLGRG